MSAPSESNALPFQAAPITATRFRVIAELIARRDEKRRVIAELKKDHRWETVTISVGNGGLITVDRPETSFAISRMLRADAIRQLEEITAALHAAGFVDDQPED